MDLTPTIPTDALGAMLEDVAVRSHQPSSAMSVRIPSIMAQTRWVGIGLSALDRALASYVSHRHDAARRTRIGTMIESLLQAPDIDSATRIALAFYPEMAWLAGEVRPTDHSSHPHSGSPSEQIFGSRHAELDR